MNRFFACLIVLVISSVAFAETPAATTFAAGQKIEIREGDSWSAGSIVKKEGRKYLVHYEGTEAATDEWVTIDRLRAPGAATTAPSALKAATAPAHAPAVVWNISDKVDCKWGGLWFPATITNKNGKWTLVTYDRDSGREWVESWRLRKRGSSEDLVGYATPHEEMLPGRPIRPPPHEDPAAAPAPTGVAAAAGNPRHSTEAAVPAKVAPVTPVDKSALREISLEGAVPAGDWVPDAAPRTIQLSSKPIALAGGSNSFFESPMPLCFSSAGIAAIVYIDHDPAASREARVERVDLRTGSSLGTIKMPLTIDGDDLSPDGKQLLAQNWTVESTGGERLDIWTLANPDPVHVISFAPYDKQSGSFRGIYWARFIDADHIATVNRDGLLFVWDTKGKAIWSANTIPESVPALSATGKYLAVAVRGGIAIVEPLTGKVIKTIEATGLTPVRLSFRPDGTQLAARGVDLLMIWNLADGQLKYDLSPINWFSLSTHWCSDGFVFLDGRLLVSLEKSVVVRNFVRIDRGERASGSFGGRFYYVHLFGGSGTKGTLASIVLPDAQSKMLASKINTDDVIAIKPGMKITLEVNLPDNLRQAAITALTASLTANGITVADGQPYRLVASTEQGQVREVTYSNMMGPRQGPLAQPATKLNVAEVITKLAIVGQDGKELWKRTSVMPPPTFLSMKQGQSLEQAVSESMTPKGGLFEHTRIPKFIPKDNTAVSTANLTAQGTVSDH